MSDSAINADTLGPHFKPWLLPVLFAQGKVVKMRARRLPEPPGARSGVIEATGSPWRVLVVGDSAAVAVGVARQAQGLAPALAQSLAARSGRAVHWHARGRSGLTVAGFEHERPQLLADLDGAARFDLIVTSLGTNDAVDLTTSLAFSARMQSIVAALGSLLADDGRLLFGRAPPLGCSPLFGNPLRQLIQWRILRINQLLEALAAERAHCTMTGQPTHLLAEDFAEDGFHPNAASYRIWGEHLADCFLAGDSATGRAGAPD